MAFENSLSLPEGIFAVVSHNPGEIAAAELRFRHRDGSWQFLLKEAWQLKVREGRVQPSVSGSLSGYKPQGCSTHTDKANTLVYNEHPHP